MWKTIFLLGVIFSVGAALTIFVYPDFSVVNEIQNIPTHLQNIYSWLSKQSLPVLASIGGAVTSISIGVGKLWSKFTGMKQQAQEAQELAYNTQTAATQEFQKLNDTIKAKETTITNQADQIESLKTQLANAPNQEEIQRLETKIENLNAERNAVERAVSLANQPTDTELIKRLTKAGYTVTKTVE